MKKEKNHIENEKLSRNEMLKIQGGTETSGAGSGNFWWTRILIQGQFPLE